MTTADDRYAQAAAVLAESPSVALSCHVNPDPDALGSMLGLVEGRLVVGPAGLAAAASARVGEVIAWPGRIMRPISEEGMAKVQRGCRSSEVLAVVPASASVAETRYESDLAERWAAKQDIAFSAALLPVRQCLERVRLGGGNEPGTPCELLVPPTPPAPPPPPQPR